MKKIEIDLQKKYVGQWLLAIAIAIVDDGSTYIFRTFRYLKIHNNV